MSYHPVPGSVLALDTATSLGWAFGAPSRRAVHGVFKLPAPGISIGAFGNAFSNALCGLLGTHSPERIVIEAPIAKHTDNLLLMRCTIGLNFAAHTIAACWGVPIEEVSAQRVRSVVLGQARFSKEEGGPKVAVMAWATAHGYDPATHDAADALATLHWALAMASPAGTGRRAA
jgi:hypothetical protein